MPVTKLLESNLKNVSKIKRFLHSTLHSFWTSCCTHLNSILKLFWTHFAVCFALILYFPLHSFFNVLCTHFAASYLALILHSTFHYFCTLLCTPFGTYVKLIFKPTLHSFCNQCCTPFLNSYCTPFCSFNFEVTLTVTFFKCSIP